MQPEPLPIKPSVTGSHRECAVWPQVCFRRQFSSCYPRSSGRGRASFLKTFGILDEVQILAVGAHKSSPLCLVLAGRNDGIGESLCRLVVSLGLEERVLFTGQVKDVEGIWSIADIALLSSYQDGLSNGVLEGIVSGLMIVVTKVGAKPEALLNDVIGLVVLPGLQAELGTAILTLATDELKRLSYGAAA